QLEEDLVKYIEKLTRRHLQPTSRIVQNFASAVASNPCSESWVTCFLYCHCN
ncbi:uncharacterized protein M421DRAFT_73352, partial [Didymella exigua CBS 183.55]